jgi:hypothetical protein
LFDFVLFRNVSHLAQRTSLEFGRYYRRNKMLLCNWPVRTRHYSHEFITVPDLLIGHRYYQSICGKIGRPRLLSIATYHESRHGVCRWVGVTLYPFLFRLCRSGTHQHGGGVGKGSVELLQFATKYTWIWAAIAVASVSGMTMQSLCLATLDTKTLFLAVFAAGMTNILEHIALHKIGVVGATFATVMSLVVSTCILFTAVRRKMKEWREKELYEQQAVNGEYKKEQYVQNNRRGETVHVQQ